MKRKKARKEEKSKEGPGEREERDNGGDRGKSE